MRLIRKVIKQALREDREVITKRLDKIANQLDNLNKQYDDLNAGLQDCSDRVDKAVEQFIPALNTKIAEISSALAIKVLDMDAHSRKWSVIIQGLPGEQGETADATRRKCVGLAISHLGVADAASADFAACHRLSNVKNAAIIARFVDLDKRNRWLSGARGLSSHPGRVSISPDLPPIARELKKDLLIKRSDLDSETKKNASLRYLRTFPYVQLSIKGKSPVLPTVSQQVLTNKFLNVNPFIDLNMS